MLLSAAGNVTFCLEQLLLFYWHHLPKDTSVIIQASVFFALFGSSAQLKEWVLVPEVMNTSKLRQMGRHGEGGFSETGETSVCSSGAGITEGQDGTVSSLDLP